MARKGFTSIASLKGGRVGILNQTEGTFSQIRTMLARHGLQYPGDYNIVETGGVPARHKALLSGTIDAGLQSIPWCFEEEDLGMTNLGYVSDVIPDWQFVSVNADQRWAAGNAGAVERFLRVLREATEWVYSNRDAAARIAAEKLPTRLDYAGRAWDHYTNTNALTRDMHPSEAGLSEVIRVQKANGILPTTASNQTASYLDLRYLAKA
ncbi:ABC transporter substrate-binding protein [Bosea sp. SSUT16]|uniref:ABC transporter substrate-binding protein n=1 Tax=Bosea spartocytisi TaxID=2773451 RepID=A0A927I1L1_9HYPH|nr:ABC transporter substrate-binding protein [Bosea spartocytisi]MBD3847497.1 ABC transporter substrate-binding protein [Bosea spartocytisi]MCT4474561.1 ABC transporter substrate-binding protein [Bosea spartocytisi]